jgi:hypothetical protein
MPIEPLLDDFLEDVRNVVDQVLPNELVYMTHGLDVIPNDAGGMTPAVIVALLAGTGIVGQMHSAILFFGLAEVRARRDLIEDKVRAFKSSLEHARTEALADRAAFDIKDGRR